MLEKVKCVQDSDCHWYVIPNHLITEFDQDVENEDMVDSGEFDAKYAKYATGGNLNLVQLYAEL